MAKNERVYTKADIKQIRTADLFENEDSVYLHCRTCIPSKIPKGQSAQSFGNYYACTSRIQLKGGAIYPITIRCKHCGKIVWDSRHLKHAY